MKEVYIHSINNKSFMLVAETGIYLRSITPNEPKLLRNLLIKPWWDIQIIPLFDAFIILSFGSSEIFFIESNGEWQRIIVSEFKLPYVNRYVKTSDNGILFDRGGLGYFRFDTFSKEYVRLTSIETRKAYPIFRSAQIQLFSLSYNILWQSVQSNLILYHYHDQNVNEIGIFDSTINQHIVRFSPPKKIETINWYKGVKASSNTNIYSNVLACLYSDNTLLLCYQDVLYQISYNGQIINQRYVSKGCRFYGLARNFNGQIYLSELNISSNTIRLFEFEGFDNIV